MLRLDPNNLPVHLKAQIERKLANQNNTRQIKPIKKDSNKSDITLSTEFPSETTSSPRKKRELLEVDGHRISVIHNLLWQAVKHLDGAELEVKKVIPNRRFSLDIAFVKYKIAVEVDGWEFHGKHKTSHTADRERQNLLTLHGWRILRYTAKQIRGDVDKCVAEVTQLIQLVKENTHDTNKY